MVVQQKLKGAAELVMTAVQLGFSAQSGVLRTSTRSTPARSRLQQGARFDPLKSFRLFCLGVPTYASKLRLCLQTPGWCVRESRAEKKSWQQKVSKVCVFPLALVAHALSDVEDVTPAVWMKVNTRMA